MNVTHTSNIFTLSLHDALPIFRVRRAHRRGRALGAARRGPRPLLPRGAHRGGQPLSRRRGPPADRKSTRLNSSHLVISYAVFCLKKKNDTEEVTTSIVMIVEIG